MPPASPYPQAAEWFGFLQVALLYGAPVLLVAYLAARRRVWTRRQLAVIVAAAVVAMALVETVGWYLDPDYADSPRAAVASELVVAIPTLAMAAAAWLHGQRRTWPMPVRVVIPVLAAYGMMVLWMIPALFVFVSLGGDTL